MMVGPSNRRVAAAEATRRQILETARRLFVAQGYAASSIQQIAAEAGVAVQTIYSSVGGKAALVLALNDDLDDDAEIGRRARQMGEQNDPLALLAAAVDLTRVLNERGRDLLQVLLSAAPAEPDVARAVADGMERHRQGAERVAARLAAMGALAGGQDARSAATALGLMTAPASWRQLTEGGMSFDQAGTWVLDSLTRLLLANR
jgi:AcrR family transcriptional regulator